MSYDQHGQDRRGRNDGDRSGNQPGERHGDRSGNQPGERQGDRSGNQPSERQGDRSGNQPGERQGDRAEGQQGHRGDGPHDGHGQGRRRGRRRPSHRPHQRQDGSGLHNATVTVVIPLLNEEESLPELASRLEQVLERVAPRGYDVIFIDDGSTDGSYDVLRDIHARNHRFKAIRFRRNYGKSAALAVGFAEAKGDIVITMDADLQDDPSEIPSLITKLSGGYDLVSGWKRKRHDPWHKTLPSKLFNMVTSAMSGLKLHDFNCGLKAYRREVVETVQVYGEMHRYIPALAHWEGFRVAELAVQHHARKHGVSKFGMSRFLKGFLDLLTVMFTTRFVKRPLHFFGSVGALFAIVGFLTDLYLAIEWFLERTSLSNRPLALFGVAMIIVGVQLISIGLIGELIVKNNLEGQRYSIRERLT